MPIFWNDIEILQVIDESERENSIVVSSGLSLMQAVAARHDLIPAVEDYSPFVHELLLARDAGLLTLQEVLWPNGPPPDPNGDPNSYLQRVQNIALTIAGRDRARGRLVQVELPDPDEDDGRLIRGSTLEEVARVIGDAYTGTQLERFLTESGIPREYVPEFDAGTKWVFVYDVLVALAEGGAAQRRELRGFLGEWLDHRLHSGPEPELQARLARDLARQGWFVREARLVIGDPVYDQPAAGEAVARDARLAALHPKVLEVSATLFEQGQAAAAILEAFKAVNNRAKLLSGLDADGKDLMARAFRPEGPVLSLADLGTETGRNVQAGYHQMFMGAVVGIRNPRAHEQFEAMNENEALEELGFASLLMRRLDDAQARIREP